MTITSTQLTRASGLSAVAAGLLFIGVQIKHPHLDATFVTTTEYTVRESLKVVMGVLSLIGITGMYLRQVRQVGILGLLGYFVFGAGYIILISVQVIGLCVLPFLARSAPGYVNDVLAVAVGGKAIGDIGPIQTLDLVGGLTFLSGGFLFGIALFRAGVLARWAAALLAGGAVATIARTVLPQVNPRLFAVPIGLALIGLGYSLWRDQRTPADRTSSSPSAGQLDPAGVR